MPGQICLNERLRVLNLCKAQNRRKLDAKRKKKKKDGEAACMHIYALHSILCLWRHKTDGCGDLILKNIQIQSKMHALICKSLFYGLDIIGPPQ